MKFRQYGYTEKTIEVRKMSMGAIVLTACWALIKANQTDMEIRIVDCYTGTVDRWAGVEEILKNDWPADYKVDVYDMCAMHNNRENYDYLKIIINDDAEK